MKTRSHPLSQAHSGQDFRIRAIHAREPGHARRLRELGLLEGRTIHLLSNHDPLLCRVGNSKLGLSRSLAREVIVEPLVSRSASDG